MGTPSFQLLRSKFLTLSLTISFIPYLLTWPLKYIQNPITLNTSTLILDNTHHLGYCSSLLSSLSALILDSLYSTLHTAVRTILLKCKAGWITLLLSALQWFPILFRIKIKVFSMAYKALQNLAHSCFSDLIPDSFILLIILASYHFLQYTKNALPWALCTCCSLDLKCFPYPEYPQRLNFCFIFISASITPSKWPSLITLLKIASSSPYPALFFFVLIPHGMYAFPTYLLSICFQYNLDSITVKMMSVF